MGSVETTRPYHAGFQVQGLGVSMWGVGLGDMCFRMIGEFGVESSGFKEYSWVLSL